jgi:hypothetical protein
VARAKGKEYGKDSTANPAVSKYARLSEDNASGAVSWEEVDGRLIKAALVAATEDGCALIFSKTSDGGALSITVLAGADRHKKYAKSSELAESVLHEVIALAGG